MSVSPSIQPNVGPQESFPRRSNRILRISAVLELFVGGILILGGSALTLLFRSSLTESFGIIHLSLGIISIIAALGLFLSKEWALFFTIGLNSLSIGFSGVSDGLLVATNILPPNASSDSLVGTLVVILLGVAVITMLMKRKSKRDSIPISKKPGATVLLER